MHVDKSMENGEVNEGHCVGRAQSERGQRRLGLVKLELARKVKCLNSISQKIRKRPSDDYFQLKFSIGQKAKCQHTVFSCIIWVKYLLFLVCSVFYPYSELTLYYLCWTAISSRTETLCVIHVSMELEQSICCVISFFFFFFYLILLRETIQTEPFQNGVGASILKGT